MSEQKDYGQADLDLADLLFPSITKTPQSLLEEDFPPRKLPEGAQVTRFAPSPTGFLHLGGVFGAMIDERAAHLSGGRFILRIEDTDKKREIEDGVKLIVQGLSAFGINFDEGPTESGDEIGDYGPYTQSKRAPLYHAFAKEMVRRGHAYPCFCTEQQIADLRAGQENEGVTPGYHGQYARCRNLSAEQIEQNLKNNMPWVLRLRSPGKPGERVKLRDVIRGEIDMEANFTDAVLLKSDGIPTYHFAHVTDDTLMRITHIVRGEEWVPSAPLHLQIFYLLDIKPPKFCHTSAIMKEENGGKRKLSKRKDPEAAADYFAVEGYPADGVVQYLLNIANSAFEDWQRQNKGEDFRKFPFKIAKLSPSGALFDLQKLKSVSAGCISLMTAEQVLTQVLTWAQKYNEKLHAVLSRDCQFATAIFAIDRGGAKPRKDIEKWGDVEQYLSYFYDELWDGAYESVELDGQLQADIIKAYADNFDINLDKQQWFDSLKTLCPDLNMCPDVKQYKANPELYKGHVGQLASVIRVALTGRQNTPDLHSIITLLGEHKCRERLEKYTNYILREGK